MRSGAPPPRAQTSDRRRLHGRVPAWRERMCVYDALPFVLGSRRGQSLESAATLVSAPCALASAGRGRPAASPPPPSQSVTISANGAWPRPVKTPALETPAPGNAPPGPPAAPRRPSFRTATSKGSSSPQPQRAPSPVWTELVPANAYPAAGAAIQRMAFRSSVAMPASGNPRRPASSSARGVAPAPANVSRAADSAMPSRASRSSAAPLRRGKIKRLVPEAVRTALARLCSFWGAPAARPAIARTASAPMGFVARAATGAPARNARPERERASCRRRTLRAIPSPAPRTNVRLRMVTSRPTFAGASGSARTRATAA
jgi:hypothetical protein